jgi:hypothetical protein
MHSSCLYRNRFLSGAYLVAIAIWKSIWSQKMSISNQLVDIIIMFWQLTISGFVDVIVFFFENQAMFYVLE